MRVSICICTHKRPKVADTVRSIFHQTGMQLSESEIIVCDDDPDGSARALVSALAVNAPLPVRYVLCGAQNVAICRNKCVEFAHADWIAFLDDDETADPSWLAEMLSCQERYAADVVKAHVRAIYPPQCPQWILAGDPFTRDYGPQGTVLKSAATNGVLFRRSIAADNGVRFDPRFGRTGGEDIDFFGRIHRAGGRLVSCPTAVVSEHVPPIRVSESYLRHRSRRNGHIRGATHVARLNFFLRILNLMKSVVIAAICPSYPLVAPVSRRVSFNMFSKFWLHFGVLEWALGRNSLTMEN
jgi:succinoglycan biosynthesis protein ExoM